LPGFFVINMLNKLNWGNNYVFNCIFVKPFFVLINSDKKFIKTSS